MEIKYRMIHARTDYDRIQDPDMPPKAIGLYFGKIG